MSDHEDSNGTEDEASGGAAHTLSSAAHIALLALAGFGLLVVVMIIANAKEPYGGPLEA